jgi:type 1 glutamine amidotransferase
MSFLNPFFLLALLAVGLPLLLHLLKLRKAKKLSFSTLQFFKALEQTTLRRVEIKRWLLLLLRMLALACLAMVLARPFLPPNSFGIARQNASVVHAILIDNSPSMARVGPEGPLIEQAQKLALEMIENGRDRDRFVIQHTTGTALFNQISQAATARALAQEISIKRGGNYLSKRYSELVELIQNAPYAQKNIYFITDGQSTSLTPLVEYLDQVNDSTADSQASRPPLPTTIISLGNAEVQNTYVSKVELSSDLVAINTSSELFVEVRNASSIPVANQFLTLEFNDQQVGQYTLSLGPEESRTLGFEIVPSSTGSNTGLLRLEGDEFGLDNERALSVFVPDQRNILWLEESSAPVGPRSPLELVLQTLSNPRNSSSNALNITKRTLNSWDEQELDEFDAVLIHGLTQIPDGLVSSLLPWIQDGHGLWVIPSSTSQLPSYNRLLSSFNAGQFIGQIGDYGSYNVQTNASELIENHPLFDGLFDKEEREELSIDPISVYYQFRHNATGADGGFNLIQNSFGEPLLFNKAFGNGQLLVSSLGYDAGFSNIQLKPIFPPLIYRALIFMSSSQQGGLDEHELGSTLEIEDEQSMASAQFVQGDKKWTAREQQSSSGLRFSGDDQEWESGWIQLKNDARQRSIALLSPMSESIFTVLDKQSWETRISDSPYLSLEELSSEQLSTEIQAISFGREIWTWFLLAGLFFLLLETMVSAFYSPQKYE